MYKELFISTIVEIKHVHDTWSIDLALINQF